MHIQNGNWPCAERCNPNTYMTREKMGKIIQIERESNVDRAHINELQPKPIKFKAEQRKFLTMCHINSIRNKNNIQNVENG